MLRKLFKAILRKPNLNNSSTIDSTESASSLDIYDVFSVSTMASKSYIDRSHLPPIRNLKRALEQPGKIVGLFGPSKSGKTTFVRKVLSERGTGFLFVNGQQITSVDDYWRQIAEKLKLALQTEVEVQQGHTEQVSVEGSVHAKFSMNVVGAEATASLTSLSDKMLVARLATEPISSVRTLCIEFLSATKTAIILDDFHEIRDPDVRKNILRDIKPEAGEETGKFVFVSIPKDAFSFKGGDEQYRNRFSFYEFPIWGASELQMIASKGFDLLRIQHAEKQLTYIERNSLGNPLNVQQICINVCTNLRDIYANNGKARILPANAVNTALEDFAREHQDFLNIIYEAEKLGTATDREKTYKYEGVDLNIYQMAFAAISTMNSGRNGLPVKSIAKRIEQRSGTAIKISRVERILEVLASVEFEINFANLGPNESGSKKPFVYSADEKKIYITNPIFRMFLLWGYRPSAGLENPVRAELVDSENELKSLIGEDTDSQ